MILKNIYSGRNISEKDYGITKEELGDIIESFNNGGYITGISVSRGWLNNVSEIICVNPQLSSRGKEYFSSLK